MYTGSSVLLRLDVRQAVVLRRGTRAWYRGEGRVAGHASTDLYNYWPWMRGLAQLRAGSAQGCGIGSDGDPIVGGGLRDHYDGRPCYGRVLTLME